MCDFNGSAAVWDVQLVSPLERVLLGMPLGGCDGVIAALHGGDIHL